MSNNLMGGRKSMDLKGVACAESPDNSGGLRKVLLAYPSRPPLLAYLQRAFQQHGVVVEMVYLDNNHWVDRIVFHTINKLLHNLRMLPKGKYLFSSHPLAHKNYRSNNLLKACRDFQPDLVLLVRGPSCNAPILEEISRSFLLFGWWIEMEGRMEEAFREIALFDWYFFINSSCVEEGMRRGHAHVSLLQHAVDPDVFRKTAGINKTWDICFVGNWSQKRQSYIEALLKVTDNIVIFGDKWLKKNISHASVRRCVRGRFIDGDGLVELYNGSRIVLNITNWGRDAGSNRSGINMRVLEVPATGSFLLTDGSRDMERVVLPGEHVAVYEDVDDCVRLAEYYLRNENEREQIALSGYNHIRAKHTYNDIVKIVADKYESLIGHARQRREE